MLDAVALFVLGSFGFFGWPEMFLLHAAIAVTWLATRNGRPAPRGAGTAPNRPSRGLVAARPGRLGRAADRAARVAGGPVQDVLPNHVAPVEHIRVFGSFSTLTTSPSPIYGPSRLMLGYVALLGS